MPGNQPASLPGLGAAWSAGHELDWTSEPIGEGEYFVLGDNVAVSIDGRTESQGVAAKQIVGKVEKN